MIPDVNIAVLGPVGVVAIGAMAVLLGEVLLSRAKSFLGREINASLIGSVLAGIAVFSLANHWQAMTKEHPSEVFNPANPLFQLDPFSALVTARSPSGSFATVSARNTSAAWMSWSWVRTPPPATPELRNMP